MSRTQARSEGHGIIAGRTKADVMHANTRTDGYLHSLARGAAVVDPGDLDPATEQELAQRTATGELRCELNHGRRVWRKT